MSAFDHKAFFDAARADPFGGKLTQKQVNALNRAIAAGLGQSIEPAWLTAARSKIGQREVPGPKHNNWITTSWAKLGAGWFNSDEVLWCGLFVAWAMNEAGIAYPKQFPRALAWADWGVECEPQVGAVCVMERSGGGHVMIAVGKSRFGDIKGLGGNQSNMVSIADFPAGRITDWRWPAGVPQSHIPLPIMAAGTISRNEA